MGINSSNYKNILILLFFVILLLFSISYAQTISWVSGYPKPLSGGRIELRWDVVPGATSYTIYRIEGAGNPYPAYVYTSVSTNTYVDTNTKDGVLYSYVISTTANNNLYTSTIGSAKADKTKPSIENLSAIPNPFSPDGDGFRDKVTISFYLSEYATVTVTLRDSNNSVYTVPDWNGRVCPNDGTYNLEWDGYFGSTLAGEGIVIYTITATDYAGNTNSTTGKLILDIPDISINSLIATPNPFSSSLRPDATYTLSYSYFVNNPFFNLTPSYYLDQSGIVIGGVGITFNTDPPNSTIPSIKISIYDTKANYVRSFQYDNVTSTTVFYWYGEKDLELVKEDPTYTGSWWYKVLGNPVGEYKVVLEATYTILDPSNGAIISVPLKPLTTNVVLGEIITLPEDTTPPKVLTISPKDGSLVSDIKVVSAILDDGNGVGPDLDMSTIRVKDTIGRYVGGIQSNNGVDTLYWTFAATLTSGYYTIEVIPVDKKGNKGELVTSRFIIDNSAPQIIDISPKNAVIKVSEIEVQYQDIGSGLNLWDNYPYPPVGSHIELLLPDGASRKLVFNKSKTSSSLAIADIPNDLQLKDGVYNLGVYLVDKAGNATFTNSSFILDTTPPYVVSSSLSYTCINYTVSQVQVTVRDDGVGIDLSSNNTFLKLLRGTEVIAGPEIASTYTYDPTNSTYTNSATLILNIPNGFNWSDGDYYLIIKATDILGNSFFTSIRFSVDFTKPTIISVAPTGLVPKVDRVSVVYLETGSGIDLDRSSLNISSPSGSTSLKFEKDPSQNLLYAILSSEILSEDGRYDLNITLYDNAGNVASTSTYFILDRAKPYITSASPSKGATLVIPPSQISVEVKDSTSGIDVDLGKTYLKLKDPSGIDVGTYTYQVSQDYLTATLRVNVSSYTWTKGIYTVILKVTDRTGNSLDETYTFTLNLESAQPTGDLVVSPSVFSPKKGNLRIDFQFQATSGNITEVTIDIYSMNGKLVKTIYNHTFNTPQAIDTVIWDGKDNLGRLLPNGYYLIKVTIKESSGATKVKFKGIVLIK